MVQLLLHVLTPVSLLLLLLLVAFRCVEEALVSTFTEARRAAPAILYWPQVGLSQ